MSRTLIHVNVQYPAAAVHMIQHTFLHGTHTYMYTCKKNVLCIPKTKLRRYRTGPAVDMYTMGTVQ